jgi:hypothetical protein
MGSTAELSEAYRMRAELRAWAGYFRCKGADTRLSYQLRYGANVMAEQASESLRDCGELIRRLRR